jgi:hypothetical protein
MTSGVATLAVVSVASLGIACASFEHPAVGEFQPPAIRVEEPNIAGPDLEGFELGVVEVNALDSLRVPTDPPRPAFACGGVWIKEAPVISGTTWRVRSTSSTQSFTEPEHYLADGVDDEGPALVFHLEAATP